MKVSSIHFKQAAKNPFFSDEKRKIALCILVLLTTLGIVLGYYMPAWHRFFGSAQGKWVISVFILGNAASLLWIFWPQIGPPKQKSKFEARSQKALEAQGLYFSGRERRQRLDKWIEGEVWKDKSQWGIFIPHEDDRIAFWAPP